LVELVVLVLELQALTITSVRTAVATAAQRVLLPWMDITVFSSP
jgi:hypothetical protein